ncbi:MAG: twin-arginine translocase TatA/TatE family subunit [Verrucomicrobia bacterium]|nr:MAG: twin-arginine translocase TatA/TatE family subunit [Verrucomicrobiota bacterium]
MNTLLAVFGLGGSELMVIMAIVLILFGARKIPEFAKGLGQGIREFRKASREVQEELERATEEIDRPAPPPRPVAPPETAASGEGAAPAGDDAASTDSASNEEPKA